MKRELLLIAGLIALACVQEQAQMDADDTVLCRYVNVGVCLDTGDHTKSLVNGSAEAFRSAALYAMNPTTGDILLYDSNAGDLSGTPVFIVTETKNFSWSLPENVPMNIYCVANPPTSFLEGTDAAGLTQATLASKAFLCTSAQLSSLNQQTGGLPMSGILNVKAGDITRDNASVSIPVKNLFAKYRFTLDLSSLERGESITVTKLSVNNGNTSVPYFAEDFCQTESRFLSDFDYATPQQLSKLSKGGEANSVDIYALENCHGTHGGASHWWTVYKDLINTWPEITKCTSIQLCYQITSADGTVRSYMSRIFLGSGNMVDDFDLRRNLYKSITVKASRRTGELDPYFSFPSETYYIAPGTEHLVQYESNISDVSESDYLEEVWITDANGNATSDLYILSHDVTAGNVRIRASAGCTVGAQYWLNGGVRMEFFWPPYNSEAQSFTERRKIMMVRSRTLTFDAPNADIYPYMPVTFISRERYSYAAAQEMAASVNITSISGNIDPSYTSIALEPIDREYSIKVTLVPSRPGTLSFSATYGESADASCSPSVTVFSPTLRAFGDPHVDVYGNRTAWQWKLMDRNGSDQLSQPLREGTFKVSKRDSYGTDLRVQTSAESGTSCTSAIYMAGLDGLPGLDPENYTFSGISIPVEGSFTYPGGYTVEQTVEALVDNPMDGVSYDNRSYDYCVLQGKTEQPSFVTVTNGSYKVENMIEWPQRSFTVDLTRGGTRQCNGLQVWTEYSGVSSLSPFALNGGKVYLDEDLTVWGPVYYGKRVTNSESGQTVDFVHSIIRMYCHYNVFAAFDVQEKNHVRIDWDNQGAIDWSPLMLLNYHFGSVRARLISNVTVSPDWQAIATLLKTDITSSTRVQPVLSGFTLYSGAAGSHGTYTPGLHDSYQLYYQDYYNSNRSYMMGYYDRPSEWGYDINYDWVYTDGTDHNTDYIYWRLIATCNKPWFKIGSGGGPVNGVYITRVQKNASGDYCFNVLHPSATSQAVYLDHQGLGYLRLCPWWQGKDGRVLVNSRDLHPLTSFNASLCLVNGWYDPRPYSNGIPILKEKVGAYFFPESSSVNTRSGYPAYYSDDWPFRDCPNYGSMEISAFSHLSFGDIYSRDSSAPR